MEKSAESGLEPHVVADHPALDLMNTVARVEGADLDFLQSDADVVRWLKRTGWLGEGSAPRFEVGALLHAARELREAVRLLVARRKEGKRGDTAVLNRFLAAGASHPELVWDGPDSPRLERRREAGTPEQLLAPLAERAAELLSGGDFNLVRCCGGDDRTKSHRRRWCSMAVCGNRHKVAAFRKRRGEDTREELSV